MSYVVNTDTVEFYRGRPDHVSSVTISVIGVTTHRTLEDTHTQREPLLGSRTTARTGHRRISGRNQHHLPPRPRSTLDQLSFRSTDRSISRFPGHRGFGEEFRFEILHGDRLMVGNHTLRPHASRVRVLPGRSLEDLRGPATSPQVAGTRSLPTRTATASHLPLRSSEFGGTTAPIPSVWEVVGVVGGGRGGGHTPVDTDSPHSCGDGGVYLATHNERRIPVAEGIPIHAHRGRCGRQLSRPHHRDRYFAGQSELSIFDREAARRVIQGRQRNLAGLPDRLAATFHLERMVKCLRVAPQGLLLRDLRTFPQPRGPAARFGEHFRQLRKCRSVSRTLLIDGFVPQESAPMPFGFECAYRSRAGAQAVGVTHNLEHAFDYTALSDMPFRWARSARTTTSSTAAPITWCPECRRRVIRRTHRAAARTNLWTNSYVVVTAVGGPTPEAMKRYVENQKNA